MRLKTTTNNAVRILVECAHSDKQRITASELAGRLDLSEQNVLKIVYLLSRAGFLVNKRGRQGGVALASPPEEIFIGDVVRKIETDLAADSSSSFRGFDDLVDDAMDAFLAVLDGQTLTNLLGSRKASRGNKTKQSRIRPLQRASTRRKAIRSSPKRV